MIIKLNFRILFLFLLMLIFWSFNCTVDNNLRVESDLILIEFNDQMHSKVKSKYSGTDILVNNFSPSEYLKTSENLIKNFSFKDITKKRFEDEIGKGISASLTGESDGIVKTLNVTIYDNFSDVAIFSVEYKNNTEKELTVLGWSNNNYTINAQNENQKFWSFQGGSYESRPDWILPIKKGFSQQNYLGMNATDYGGGIPVTDIWTQNGGIAVGHIEKTPKLVSLPIIWKDELTIAVDFEKSVMLKPGETLKTYNTFVAVHKGDFYHPLRSFSLIMQAKGLKMIDPPETAYEPIWCAWGYERNFKTKQILNTLPKVKELGFEWAVLDDGWQTAEGDWYLNPKKFPNGNSDMQKFVSKINSYGLKAKLWWAPLAVDPGTDLITKHEDMLLINKDGEKQKISWWDSYYLCPAYPKTIEYTKELVKKIMDEWGYAGLKIDGQHLNGVPPCYNKAHNHKYPEESVEKLPDFFKMIYETATQIKKDAVVEICPCGTTGSFYNMLYMNQSVSSDPLSSWQIRLKGKTHKALMGSKAAYYGDHVELSDSMTDFASSVGIGAVIGTKFTWPVGAHVNKESGDVSLTPEKEKIWKKWVDIYKENELPKGEYLGELYDLCFDRPETHVIKKGNDYYYAFYADEFSGDITLRGLQQGEYELYDYFNEITIGKVNIEDSSFNTNFKGFLLVKALKVK